jgi:hypothetical protein
MSGSAWAQANVEMHKSKLDELYGVLKAIKDKQAELMLKEREQQCKDNNDKLTNFLAGLPHHHEDVEFMELSSKCLEESKRCACYIM